MPQGVETLTTDNPLISVVIPTYNRLPYLKQAVQSVFQQTYRRWELLVVDDGSTDGTAAYLATLTDERVRVLQLHHTGSPAVVRNAGLNGARGEYLSFLDSDDLWDRTKLATQLEYLGGAGSEHRWSYAGYRMIDERGAEVPMRAGGPWRPYSGRIVADLLTTAAATNLSTVLAEARLVHEVGRFDEDPGLLFREDYDLCLRLAYRAAVIAVPQVLCSVRDHATRCTGVRDDLFERSAQVYAKFEQRVSEPHLRRLCRERRAGHLVSEAGRRRQVGDLGRAAANLFEAFKCYPASGALYRELAKCAVSSLWRRVRKS